jgi:BON domain
LEPNAAHPHLEVSCLTQALQHVFRKEAAADRNRTKGNGKLLNQEMLPIFAADSEIEQDVKDKLRWRPGRDSTDITVAVNKRIVTLTGFVRSYPDKYEAEADAKRVVGVAAVTNDIEVRLPSVDQRPDPEIARDAVAAIKSQLSGSWRVAISRMGNASSLSGLTDDSDIR